MFAGSYGPYQGKRKNSYVLTYSSLLPFLTIQSLAEVPIFDLRVTKCEDVIERQNKNGYDILILRNRRVNLRKRSIIQKKYTSWIMGVESKWIVSGILNVFNNFTRKVISFIINISLDNELC